MTEKINRNGTCLCGTTKFSVENMGGSIGACHCDTCRKWGGSAFMSVGCGTEVSFESEENIAVFNSSEWAERGFCKQCGSHLFYRLKETKQHWIPVGLFEDQKNLNFDLQVFIEEKPEYYCFSNDTENLTGKELFAKFTSPE